MPASSSLSGPGDPSPSSWLGSSVWRPGPWILDLGVLSLEVPASSVLSGLGVPSPLSLSRSLVQGSGPLIPDLVPGFGEPASSGFSGPGDPSPSSWLGSSVWRPGLWIPDLGHHPSGISSPTPESVSSSLEVLASSVLSGLGVPSPLSLLRSSVWGPGLLISGLFRHPPLGVSFVVLLRRSAQLGLARRSRCGGLLPCLLDVLGCSSGVIGI